MLFLKILGTILKIIGILLVGILLLLVFILLVLLFVPIRYRARLVRNGKELLVQAQVSYLFHLVRLPVSFKDGKLQIRLCVFGITLFSNGGDKKARRRKRKRKKKSALEAKERMKEALQKEKIQAVGQTEPDAAGEGSGAKAGEDGEGTKTEGNLRQAQNGQKIQKNMEITDAGANADTVNAQGTTGMQMQGEPDAQETADTTDTTTQAQEGSDAQGTAGIADTANTQVREGSDAQETADMQTQGEPDAQDTAGTSDTADTQAREGSDAQETADMQAQEGEATQDIPGGILRPIWHMVGLGKKLLARIKALFEKIAKTIQSIKEKICAMKAKIFTIKAKITDIKGMVCLVLGFLRDEENKNGIKYAWKSILRLLKHVFPYKIEGEVVFATGDPYSMGRALSVLGMLYPLYAKKLSLSADFEADSFRLDGCVQFKGRIRFGTVLWIAWKLWSKGKLKRLLSQAKELKNKLTTSAL